MTDKPKTIQEALAQVQELAVRPPVAKFGAKQMLGTAALAGGAAIASSPEAREKISNAYQGTKDFVKHSLGMDKTPEQSAASLQKAGEKISGDGSTPAAPAKTETPKTDPAKTETPPAGSSAAKMSFNQAYAKAREMAKAAGKNPNIAQFKWGKDGGPEKTYQAAETKADYVTKNKQFAVDINAPSTTKNPADPPSPNPTASTTPKADATGTPPNVTRNIPAGSEGAKYPAEGGVRQAATGTFEKGEGYATIREPKKPETESGKKKMSEESSPIIDMFLKLQEKHALTPNIFEAAKKAKKDHDGDGNIESEKDEYFGSRFAAAKKAGKMEEDEQIDEATGLKKVVHKVFGKQIAKHRANKADSEMERTLNTRGSEKKWAKNYDARERYGRIAAGKPPFKDMDEEEQIDEISKKTLGSYIKKAASKKPYTSIHGAAYDAVSGDPKARKTIQKREKGIERATDRLTKEEVEFSQTEIDHINSFLEAVAPNRPEPTKGVNPTVRNTDLTDETLEEGRPRKNPTPETTERDARQHIQVQAGRAAGGTVVDFKHDNGKVSKLTPGMGRSITAHLNGLKPAERQEAVKRMHASPEGLKV